MKPSDTFIEKKLEERRLNGTYRELKPENNLVDFCSNDYLGFARSTVLKNNIEAEVNIYTSAFNGSTGSRLLSGNTAYAEELENWMAGLHKCEAGLIFNSGYTANLGLFSSLPQKGDTIIMDELIHASIIDGSRLSFANNYKFKHNDSQSLEDKLKQAKGICYVVVESVYSMDGDSPDIDALLKLTEKYNANLIVDEAHAVGLYGLGVINGQFDNRIFARIVTFGKALGCHGAVILSSKLLKEYLVNFSRAFIYTTAPSFHQLASIKAAYQLLLGSKTEIDDLKSNIHFYLNNVKTGAFQMVKSNSAIQCIILKCNEKAKKTSLQLQNAGLDVRPILSPTVPAGTERLRICLHSFNTKNEISLLTDIINNFTYAG